MNNSRIYRLLFPVTLPLLLVAAPVASAFELPDCTALQAWSAGYVPDESVSLAPKVKVTSLLKDEKTLPLFGQPVQAWSASDMGALRKALRQCRKAARNDKPAADRLYQALKAFDAARGQLNKAQQVRNQLNQTVERLVKYRPSPRLAGQLALSREVLQGSAPDLAAHGLQRMPDWIASFQKASDYLSASEIEGHAASLAAREQELKQQFQSRETDYAAAQKELNAAPLTAAGMQTVERLARLPWLKELTPQQQDAFRNDINRKRRAYAQAQQRQQARQQPAQSASGTKAAVVGTGYGNTQRQAAAAPDVKTHLDAILKGDEVEELSLNGLVPGMTEQQGIHRVLREWGFKETVSLSLKPAYGRKADLVEFRVMEDDAVGEIDFTLRFPSRLDNAQVLETLKTRFGDPDQAEQVATGQRLTWRDDERILQVVSSNRLDRLYRGYQSHLAFALWSEDYEEFVEQVNERCEELREKPTGQLSLADKMHMAKHCALGLGSTPAPGLAGAF